MRKKNFVSMILGTVGGILFALGMCMCLIPEWGAFTQGVVIAAVGLVVLLILLAAVYVGMLVVYSLLTVAFSLKKYKKAVRDTKKYTQRLGVLLREYDREEKGVSAGKKSHIAGADRKNKRR